MGLDNDAGIRGPPYQMDLHIHARPALDNGQTLSTNGHRTAVANLFVAVDSQYIECMKS